MSGATSDRMGEQVALRWRELSFREVNLLRIVEALAPMGSAWLLDSALDDSRLGRFSFAGSDPYSIARINHVRIEVSTRRSVRNCFPVGLRVEEGDPFKWMQSVMPPFEPDVSSLQFPFPFIGGAVGYLGYELAEHIESISFEAVKDLSFPDATLLFVDQLVVLDHASGRVFALGLGFGSEILAAANAAELALGVLCERLDSNLESSPGSALELQMDARPVRNPVSDCLGAGPPPDCAATLRADEYESRVDDLKKEIAAGNVYEANLTQRMSVPFVGDAWALYKSLRECSPAPFACYFDFPDGQILGSSPERFLCLDEKGRVESRPIKGTRRRGATPREDELLMANLAVSEKDRAENLMIVDLVRNDLGRVCRLGSIRVPAIMEIESYASVYQMVSTVTGQLTDDHDAIDLIRATFPPGSMTGAPKIAAIELLNSVEPVRRGVYAGALGYFDIRGGLDLSVVIRSIFLCKGRAYMHVGGAVVSDSTPESEYEESLDKARALWLALAKTREEDSSSER